MIKTLTSLLKQDKEKFVVPKGVQDVIPVKAIYDDGIFKVGKDKYSKTYKFTDINYAVASREDKEAMFLEYSELLNSLDSGATTKLTINNRRLNRLDFEKAFLIDETGDPLDKYRREYNKILLDKATGANAIVQDKYVTISINKKSVEDAVNAELVNLEKSAKELYASKDTLGMEFRPLAIFGTYKVTELSDSRYSLYVDLSTDYLGAHPMTYRTGYTFDPATGNKLALTDITGKTADETAALVKDAFTKTIQANPEGFFEDSLKNLDETLKNVVFYVKDGKTTLVTPLYSIAPYAAGFIEVTL